MLIANPIYDSAFKFMMQDQTVAEHFLSVILSRTVSLEHFEETEFTVTNTVNITGFSTQRMDFKAVITEANNRKRKVLIELQKTHTDTDIAWFRRYLANAYHDNDTLKKNADHQDIIAIYILGFKLNTPVAVVKTSTQLIDATTGNILDANTDDETFIRKLHHESIFIDTTQLNEKTNTRIDKLLTIFNQRYRNEANYVLDISESQFEQNDVLVAKRLAFALLDRKTKTELTVQEEYMTALMSNIAKEKVQAAQEAKQEGRQEGADLAKLTIAKTMLSAGLSTEQIIQFTGLSQEQINAL